MELRIKVPKETKRNREEKDETKRRKEGKNKKKKVEKPTNLTTVAETNEKRGGKKMWNAHDKSKE